MYVSLCVCVVLLSLLRITRICKYILFFFYAGGGKLIGFTTVFDLIHISNYLLHTHQDHFQIWRSFFHIKKKEMPNLCLFTKIYLFIQEKKKQMQV